MEEKELPRALTTEEAFSGLLDYKLAQTLKELRQETRRTPVEGVSENQPKMWDERIKVGDVVYIAYAPVQCGVVRKVEKVPDSFFTLVTFVGLKKTWTEWSFALNDFRELVADHKRKYDRHNKILKALLMRRDE